jgi:GT2 family glycosyltransferase/glycosyltransferase involved in cell wall biosynthesis
MIRIRFPSVDRPRASILILAWRQRDYLLACLRTLRERLVASVPCEVVVLFNAASDEVEDAVRSTVDGVVFLKSAVNLGFAGGCNLAATAARGKYLVLLNDDTLVEPGWLDWLLECADANPAAGAVCSCVLFPDGRLQEAGSVIWNDGSTMPVGRGAPADSVAWHFVRQVDYGSACSLLVRRSTWEAVGGMDADYHPAYYEDVDLCLGIRALGQRILFEPRSRVRHQESVSSESTYKSFLFRRNQRKLVEKWSRELAFQEPPGPRSNEALVRAVWLARGCPRRILMIDDRVPDSALGSGFGRMLEGAIELSSHGYAVSVFPTGEMSWPSDRLISAGIGIVEEDLAQHLARPYVSYDAVIVSRPHNFCRLNAIVREHQPQAPLVYDCEALFGRRLARQAQLSTTESDRLTLEAHAEAMRDLEERIAREADMLVTVSREEADTLTRVQGHCPIDVILPAEPDVRVTSRSVAERRDIGYVAGWLAGPTSPNADGLRWFVKEILPRIKVSCPWVRLRVTGGRVPADVRSLADPNVVFEGEVSDLDAFYDGLRVAVAPLRFGAGVKVKTVQAIQHGVPIVATAIGAEGIDAAELPAIDVADDPETFANLVVCLLTDPVVWHRRQSAIVQLADRWRSGRLGASWADVMSGVWARRPSAGSGSPVTAE